MQALIYDAQAAQQEIDARIVAGMVRDYGSIMKQWSSCYHNAATGKYAECSLEGRVLAYLTQAEKLAIVDVDLSAWEILS